MQVIRGVRIHAVMRSPFLVFMAVIFWLASFATIVSAADPIIDTTPGFMVSAPTNISKDLRLEAGVSYIQESDFANGLGSVNVVRMALSADYSIFNLSYGYSRFNWERKGAVSFSTEPERAPWENLHDLTLQARLLNNRLDKDGKWRYWVNGQLSSAFERDFPGAVGIGFDGGVAYDFWDGWMLGVTARTVALNPLHSDLFGERGYGLAVAVSQKALRNAMRTVGLYDASEGSDDIGFSFAFTTSEKTYRLSPDSPIESNGYLSLVYSKIGAYLDYSFSKNWTVSLGPEYYYDRKYKFYRASGREESSTKLDNGWGGYARIMWLY